MRPRPSFVAAVILLPVVCQAPLAAQAADPDLLWGDEVPEGWNGDWPAELRIVPERTDYRRTTSSLDLHEYLAVLKSTSKRCWVIPMLHTKTAVSASPTSRPKSRIDASVAPGSFRVAWPDVKPAA